MPVVRFKREEELLSEYRKGFKAPRKDLWSSTTSDSYQLCDPGQVTLSGLGKSQRDCPTQEFTIQMKYLGEGTESNEMRGVAAKLPSKPFLQWSATY